MLSEKDFKNIIKLTPLIAIDFIISYKNKYLLGKRINNPAKGYFFVPGGRIQKDEKIIDAISRLSVVELGLLIDKNLLKFYKIAEHHYKNNNFNDNFSTHYICLSYFYQLSDKEYSKLNIKNQHEENIWLTKNELLENTNVHVYTKNYFL